MSGILGGLIGSFATASTSSYESIATTTVGSGGSTTISFSSIPSSYKHLQLRGIARTNTGTSLQDVRIRFNSDSSSNYSSHKLYGDGTGAYAAGNASQTSGFAGLAVDGSVGSNAYFISGSIIDILDYTSTVKAKTIRVLSGNDSNTNTGVGYLQYGSAAWYKNTASVYESVTDITLSLSGNSYAQYSSFALYGIKGA
jgi:hypothetical protein